MEHFRAFPEIAIPPVALALGLVDDSWHNDCSAAMRFPHEREGREQETTEGLTLWIGDETSKADTGVLFQVDINGKLGVYAGGSLPDALAVVRTYLTTKGD